MCRVVLRGFPHWCPLSCPLGGPPGVCSSFYFGVSIKVSSGLFFRGCPKEPRLRLHNFLTKKQLLFKGDPVYPPMALVFSSLNLPGPFFIMVKISPSYSNFKLEKYDTCGGFRKWLPGVSRNS